VRSSVSKASWLGGTGVVVLETSNPAAAHRKLKMYCICCCMSTGAGV